MFPAGSYFQRVVATSREGFQKHLIVCGDWRYLDIEKQ